MQPHCYAGGNGLPPAERGATFTQRMLTQFAERIDKTAPKGGDMSWKY